jgi:predicted dehydrogenase
MEGKKRLVDPNLAGGALLDVGVYPINFALMTFGKDIERIESSCSLYPSSVDATDHMRLVYRDGRFAELYASMVAVSDSNGLVLGSEGYILFKNINNCEGIEIHDRDRKLVRSIAAPQQITGFEYELGASIRAIKAGKRECEEMSLSESIYVMELMDRLREEWEIRFPFE